MNNKKQCAYWFLTINEKAKCFVELQNILEQLLIDKPNIEFYYIKHNADDDEKNFHYHLVLYFKGSVSRFTTIEKLFVGAHIEMTNQQRFKRTIQYLIHKNNPEKEQYKTSDIVSNVDRPTIEDIINSNGYDFELFLEEKIFDYMSEFMKNDGRLTMQQFILRFGLSAISKYYFVLKDQIKEYNELYQAIKLRNHQFTDMQKAFDILNPCLFSEWKVYVSMGGELDFPLYKQEVYNYFVDQVDKGNINVNEVLKEKR